MPVLCGERPLYGWRSWSREGGGRRNEDIQHHRNHQTDCVTALSRGRLDRQNLTTTHDTLPSQTQSVSSQCYPGPTATTRTRARTLASVMRTIGPQSYEYKRSRSAGNQSASIVVSSSPFQLPTSGRPQSGDRRIDVAVCLHRRHAPRSPSREQTTAQCAAKVGWGTATLPKVRPKWVEERPDSAAKVAGTATKLERPHCPQHFRFGRRPALPKRPWPRGGRVM